jgi:hypothetical protein
MLMKEENTLRRIFRSEEEEGSKSLNIIKSNGIA